jgi:hypothetical protein
MNQSLTEVSSHYGCYDSELRLDLSVDVCGLRTNASLIRSTRLLIEGRPERLTFTDAAFSQKVAITVYD